MSRTRAAEVVGLDPQTLHTKGHSPHNFEGPENIQAPEILKASPEMVGRFWFLITGSTQWVILPNWDFPENPKRQSAVCGGQNQLVPPEIRALSHPFFGWGEFGGPHCCWVGSLDFTFSAAPHIFPFNQQEAVNFLLDLQHPRPVRLCSEVASRRVFFLVGDLRMGPIDTCPGQVTTEAGRERRMGMRARRAGRRRGVDAQLCSWWLP